jgi:putative lipoic acid-binding regulatory protein
MAKRIAVGTVLPPPPLDAPKYEGGYVPQGDDPLASILGPGSTTVLGKQGEEIPQEILDIYQQHDLSRYSYQCILKQIPEGATDSGNLPFVKSWSRAVPSIEFIAREYGPGNYKLIFTWRTSSDGTTRSLSDNVIFEVSDKFEAEYNEYQFNKKVAEVKRKREKIQNMKIDGEFSRTIGLENILKEDRPEVPIEEAAIKYVDNVASVAEKLGMTRQRGFDWDKMLPVVLTALPAIMKLMHDAESSRREENRQFMSLLITTLSSNNSQMVDILKSQQPQRGTDMTKELFDMIKGAIDVKEMIQGSGKESVSDRIFNVIEHAAPQLLELIKLNAMQRANDPRMLLAQTYMKTNPDFQALDKSPQVLSEVTQRMDEVFGWKQTDAILAALKYPRNADCPRDPARELPIDQREPSFSETQAPDPETPGEGTVTDGMES